MLFVYFNGLMPPNKYIKQFHMQQQAGAETMTTILKLAANFQFMPVIYLFLFGVFYFIIRTSETQVTSTTRIQLWARMAQMARWLAQGGTLLTFNQIDRHI